MRTATVQPDAPAQEAWRDLTLSLRSWLRKRVADPATADDLVQTVFLRVHERGRQLHDVERLVPWVWSIARHALIDHYRQRRPHVPLLAAEVAQPDPVADELAGLAHWLAAQIDAVPEKYREALRLTELEGLTMDQASKQLGLSVSGVKSRVRRGRALLKAALLRCCAVELDQAGQPVDYVRRRQPGQVTACCATECETG